MELLAQLQRYAKSKDRVGEKFIPDLSLYVYYFKRRPFFIIDLYTSSIMFKNENNNLSRYLGKVDNGFLLPIGHLLNDPWVNYQVTDNSEAFNRNMAMLKYILDHCYIEIMEEISMRKGLN